MAAKLAQTGPNDPCICGSGRKYKRCCGTPEAIAARQRVERNRLIRRSALIVVGLFVAVGAVWGLLSLREPNYVPAPVFEEPTTGTRPPGPAPEGKVWSEEHGHWHDVGPNGAAQHPATPATPATRPPGPALEGKVWSEEHGHWHDAVPQ